MTARMHQFFTGERRLSAARRAKIESAIGRRGGVLMEVDAPYRHWIEIPWHADGSHEATARTIVEEITESHHWVALRMADDGREPIACGIGPTDAAAEAQARRSNRWHRWDTVYATARVDADAAAAYARGESRPEALGVRVRVEYGRIVSAEQAR